VAFFVISPYSLLAGAIAVELGGRRGSATAAGLIDTAGYLGAVASGVVIGTLAQHQGWPAARSGCWPASPRCPASPAPGAGSSGTRQRTALPARGGTLMLVDLVVLDIAGTTVYDGDAVHRCLADAVALADVDASREEINRVMGMPKPQAIAALIAAARGAPPDDDEVALIYTAFERAMIDHYRLDPTVRETDGAADVLRRLRSSGVKVALDTGFARAITDVVVERLDWGRGVVDVTVSADEVPRGRPYPDMVLRAMKLAGVADPSRVAKVGDTPADLLEGTAAGCGFVIGVTSGSHTQAELEPHPHTHLISSLRELLPIVQGPPVRALR
jgi:phosphonatase-like hydrolase